MNTFKAVWRFIELKGFLYFALWLLALQLSNCIWSITSGYERTLTYGSAFGFWEWLGDILVMLLVIGLIVKYLRKLPNNRLVILRILDNGGK